MDSVCVMLSKIVCLLYNMTVDTLQYYACILMRLVHSCAVGAIWQIQLNDQTTSDLKYDLFIFLFAADCLSCQVWIA